MNLTGGRLSIDDSVMSNILRARPIFPCAASLLAYNPESNKSWNTQTQHNQSMIIGDKTSQSIQIK